MLLYVKTQYEVINPSKNTHTHKYVAKSISKFSYFFSKFIFHVIIIFCQTIENLGSSNQSKAIQRKSQPNCNSIDLFI